MSNKKEGKPSRGILQLNIRDITALEEHYMPFLRNGGLFIPSRTPYRIGNQVFIMLTLMDEKERLPIPGTVVWITPQSAQSAKRPGVGVQFEEQFGEQVRIKIEHYLESKPVGRGKSGLNDDI